MNVNFLTQDVKVFFPGTGYQKLPRPRNLNSSKPRKPKTSNSPSTPRT
ncbi:MAG: hypothetical protein MZU97_22630 [Bacillus subtilis]|nr:hypothetical protein [Bacillus subtilis]